ncbi:MAG: dual specificity protein phosphatase family protein [Chloroflexi bacterium]|nr:dual specificity protein phosphatase family protein [Chloroflexota bacterium]MCI0846221.1 dual specificity protein phosphatase family protein [Chloroflexota bacterium]
MAYLNFSWILEDSLAAAQGPTTRRDLIFLQLQDIRAIVRMEENTISGEALEMVDLYEPVPDYTAPSLEQIHRMVTFIEAEIETWEHPVVVTCQAGLGRTGTVLASYLVYVGYKPEDAIKLIRNLRPGSIQTADQEDSIKRYHEYLQDRERERIQKARDLL